MLSLIINDLGTTAKITAFFVSGETNEKQNRSNYRLLSIIMAKKGNCQISVNELIFSHIIGISFLMLSV